MIILYQYGRVAARKINPRNSGVDPGLERTPSVCHSRLPPPHQGVYKKARDAQNQAVTALMESSSFGSPFQENNSASRGRSPSVEKLCWTCPIAQGHHGSLTPWLQPFPGIGHHMPPSASLALFYVTDSSGMAISSSSSAWLPGGL